MHEDRFFFLSLFSSFFPSRRNSARRLRKSHTRNFALETRHLAARLENALLLVVIFSEIPPRLRVNYVQLPFRPFLALPPSLPPF